MSDSSALGNLGQAARGKQLRMARIIMLIVGLLTLSANGFVMATNRSRLDSEIADLRRQGFEVDESKAAGRSRI